MGKPTVLVLLNGSALAVNWARDHVPAIVEAWYPGQAGGQALADILFGDYNPAGRLPVTFYKSVEQLPAFTDCGMKGRTYRFFSGEPLYPFGFGLSYTLCSYTNLRHPGSAAAGEDIQIAVDVRNSGNRAGEEVVQVYVTPVSPSRPMPIRWLAGFERVKLRAGERKTVRFTLAGRQFAAITADGHRQVEPGTFEISVGGGQPGVQAAAAGAAAIQTGTLRLTGTARSVE